MTKVATAWIPSRVSGETEVDRDEEDWQELDLDDRIKVQVGCDGMLADALRTHWALIADEVLATGEAPDASSSPTGGKEFDVDGMSASIEIVRV